VKLEDRPRTKLRDRLPRPPRPAEALDKMRDTEFWKSMFRPGSIFRKGYKDTQRDRALAMMNNVLYHLHPVKIKRHGLKLTYTFCLGGLSFFLFVLLTVTGIFLMFFYRPAATLGNAVAYHDVQAIRTSVYFGDLVRNIHRWGAHLMVFTVSLHMARVFYTGAYKPPREFNWVVGVILLVVTFLLSYTGYLLPWDQLSLWAVTVGVNMVGSTPPPAVGDLVKFFLIGDYQVGQNALLRFYTLHVIALPLLLAIFLAVHFWRIRKDGFSRGLTFTSRLMEHVDTRSAGARAAGKEK
jgi:quinol---cytochrome c reductase cytochrome b subunit, bacillus type